MAQSETFAVSRGGIATPQKGLSLYKSLRLEGLGGFGQSVWVAQTRLVI